MDASLLIAFTAGLLTILAPCILPILPVVLAGGTQHGRRRPLGLGVGITASFTSTTLGWAWVVQQFQFSSDTGRWVGIGMLFLFGVAMAAPQIMDRTAHLGYRFIPERWRRRTVDGWWGGLFLGLGLGAVWAPCVGPILGTVIIAAQSSTVTLGIFFTAIAYALGVAIPLSVIAFFGQRLRTQVRFLSRWSGPIQRVFGFLLMLFAIGFFFRLDVRLQNWVLQSKPRWVPVLQKCESGVPLKLQKENQILQLEVDMEAKF